ncbi:hypothetical protein ES703_115457 [subsurface metagenome]
MALVDKYGNSSLAMLLAALEGLPIDKLRLVLRFAELLAKTKGG